VTTDEDDFEWSYPQGSPPIRIGQGFDVHPFATAASRELVLGGVRIPGERGLDGHSDADVVAHAVADALLGAASCGELGQLFPDSDPRFEDADSMDLLARVVDLVWKSSYRATNVDCTIICDRPRLAGFTDAMSAKLESVVHAPVGVKPKRAEGLGSLGRGEGIACIAVALLVQSPTPDPKRPTQKSPTQKNRSAEKS